MDEQEHPAEAEAAGASAEGATPPVTEPAIPRPERRRRGEGARKALTSRGAGWVAAAVLAGAVVALSVVLATAPSTTVLQPGAARSFRFVPAGGGAEIVSLPPNVPLRGVVGPDPGERAAREREGSWGPASVRRREACGSRSRRTRRPEA